MSTPIESADLDINRTIGALDRVLSELLVLVRREHLDEPDAKTLDHHADDLIGVGNKLKDVLRERGLQ